METPLPVLSEEAFIDALSHLMGQCLASEADADMVLRNLTVTTAHVLRMRMTAGVPPCPASTLDLIVQAQQQRRGA